MSRVVKRRGATLLALAAMVGLAYLALPLYAGMNANATQSADAAEAKVLCAESSRDGVILVECEQRSWFSRIGDSDLVHGAQTKFRDPIF